MVLTGRYETVCGGEGEGAHQPREHLLLQLRDAVPLSDPPAHPPHRHADQQGSHAQPTGSAHPLILSLGSNLPP